MGVHLGDEDDAIVAHGQPTRRAQALHKHRGGVVGIQPPKLAPGDNGEQDFAAWSAREGKRTKAAHRTKRGHRRDDAVAVDATKAVVQVIGHQDAAERVEHRRPRPEHCGLRGRAPVTVVAVGAAVAGHDRDRAIRVEPEHAVAKRHGDQDAFLVVEPIDKEPLRKADVSRRRIAHTGADDDLVLPAAPLAAIAAVEGIVVAVVAAFGDVVEDAVAAHRRNARTAATHEPLAASDTVGLGAGAAVVLKHDAGRDGVDTSLGHTGATICGAVRFRAARNGDTRWHRAVKTAAARNERKDQRDRWSSRHAASVPQSTGPVQVSCRRTARPVDSTLGTALPTALT